MCNVSGEEFTAKNLIEKMQQVGTEAALLELCETLNPEEERRFWRAFNIYQARAFEKTKSGGNIYRRGKIVSIVERAYHYALGHEEEVTEPDYTCSKCNGEHGVLAFNHDYVFLKCRKCGFEEKINFENGKKND